MMNILALGLVLSSLAAASVWSPQPEKQREASDDHRPQRPPGDPAVYREGHRVIVVEYEREAPQQPSVQTPSQLSHPSRLQPSGHRLPGGVVEEAKEKFKDAASVLPNLGQGISTPLREEGKEVEEDLKAPAHGAKERICDAYGVCKDKISGLLGKSREKAAQVEEAAKEAVTGAVEKAKEVKEEVAGNVSEVTEQALEKARSGTEKAKELGKGAVETAKEMERGAVETAKEAKKKAAEMAREAQGTASEKTMEVRKNLTDIVQRAREVARDLAAYVGLKQAADALAAVLHLLGFATAYGSCVWVTFVSSHVLAQALPRQQFGMLQSKLYPVYFRAMAYAVGVALLSHAFGPAGRRRSSPERLQGYVLLASLVLVLINMLFLEPKATKLMYERMKLEKEEGRGRDMADVGVETTRTTTQATATATPATGTTRTAAPPHVEEPSAEEASTKSKMAVLNRKLKSLNNYSSLLNVMTLMGLTWHLVHLARVLQAAG
ncbi:hypothetical protein Taro_005123 [Colocasia esculenta]|uniref:TMEM205-like domain-containing protein n=1 Tax=Colocasia esculenta TaxID=4460 RepID=A0A843TTL1_COLES|nr:hypothetical protein [Colocasia esculenta]